MNLSYGTVETGTQAPLLDQAAWPPDFWPRLFDQMPAPVLVFNQKGRILLANDEAVRRLGLEGATDFTLPASLTPLRDGALSLPVREMGPRAVTMPSPADGNPVRFLLRHIDDGLVLAVGQDASSPAPSVGESLSETAAMATAVRCQVDGPLAGIELYASMAGQELEEAGDSALADMMERIRANVAEVNEYLTNFSAMSGPLRVSLEPCKLTDVVDEALGALGDVFKERNVGVLVTQKDLTVDIDRGLMVQLLLNLLLNAVEAMPQGGRLFIELSDQKPGQAEIIVTDTGPGVGQAEAKRLFSPFYTTKAQPLGLGLPVSLRIAEAHQGTLALGNDLRMGARAVLSLPHFPGAAAPARLN